MFWSQEQQRQLAVRASLGDASRARRATFTLLPEEARKDPSQLDIAECAEYDRKADARKVEYDISVFRVAVDTLFARS